jgi:succinoglycan biosynthesis protein ExoO
MRGIDHSGSSRTVGATTVSVVVPAYNAASSIERAVRSVLGQSHKNLELIVVDDCSSDATAAVALGAGGGDERMRLVSTEENRGPSHARNLGISLASGTWVTFLDADDAYLARRLERMLTIAGSHNADLVADNQELLREGSLQPVGRLFELDVGAKQISFDEFVAHNIPPQHRTWGLLKPLVQRSFLTANAIAYDEQMRFGEDYVFLAECFLGGARVILSAEATYAYTLARSGLAVSRSVRDLRRLLEINEQMMADDRSTALSPAARDALGRRGVALARNIQHRQFVETVRAHRWAASVGMLVTEPGLTAFVYRSSVQRLTSRARAARQRKSTAAGPLQADTEIRR